MASTSENTAGAKILNAETIVKHLSTFTTYAAPRTSESVANMQTLITSLKTSNTNEASKLQAYSLAVENRQKLFSKDPDSVQKLLSPIGSSVKAQYGKNSKEAKDCMGLINKIRGNSPIKDKAKPTENSISQSETSYGSITQAFSDLIAGVTILAPAHNPANNAVKLPQLNTKLTQIQTTNSAVVTAYGSLQKERKTRNDLFADLKERIIRIKDAVKSQYGINSVEYGLVKKLAV